MNSRRQPDAGESRTANAIKDPTERFNSPDDVLDDRTLSVDEKRKILTSWVKDSELMAEAESENMGGGESARLRESRLALAKLDTASPPHKTRA